MSLYLITLSTRCYFCTEARKANGEAYMPCIMSHFGWIVEVHVTADLNPTQEPKKVYCHNCRLEGHFLEVLPSQNNR